VGFKQFLGHLPQELQLLFIVVNRGQLLSVVVVMWMIMVVLVAMGVARC